jgi:hypothetical protein
MDLDAVLIKAFKLQLRLLRQRQANDTENISVPASELGDILNKCELHASTEAEFTVLRRAQEVSS